MDLLIYFISLLFMYLINIPIHELGHLLGGLASGYSFVSYRLGPFVWTKTNGRVQFSVSKFAAVLGQCLMMPPEDERDFKFILYNASGGLANIVFFVLCIIPMRLFPESNMVFSIFYGGAISALIVAATNLIPIKASVPNDGYNIKVALQSDDAKHGFYIMLTSNQRMVEGERLRDCPEDMFQISSDADKSNIFVANMLILEAARLYDCGEYEEYVAVYQGMNPDVLPGYYANSIYFDYLYYYIIHNPDYDKAREIWGRKGMDKFMKMGNPSVTRIMAAYEFFVNGDMEKGRELLSMAKKQAEGYPVKGFVIMESEYIAMLEAKMNKASE